MNRVDDAYRAMDFDFFGNGRHQTRPAAFFDNPGAVLVDLRSDQERALLTVRLDWLTTIHMPLHELPDRYQEIPTDAPVGLFCSSDTRSALALAYLRARGYTSARILAGGYQALVDELKPGKVYQRLNAGG